jgi:6-pyruvoyltetrahydropterin/6-carboxytetrahydropterin synthase
MQPNGPRPNGTPHAGVTCLTNPGASLRGAATGGLLVVMRARVTKDFRFEAAHTLPSLPEGHKCRQMHGHSFKVEISIEGEVDESVGWVYDHKKISEAMAPLLDVLDHAYLNDIEGLESPTIERMAGWFWKKLSPQLPGLAEIVIFETPTARCSFKGEF